MLLTCPSCATTYDVGEGALGPAGRKVRCRACGTSWFQPPVPAPASILAPVPAPDAAAPPPAASPPARAPATASPSPSVDLAEERVEHPPARRARGPWLLLALVVLVAVLGIVAASLAFGPREVAARFGLADAPVPLGIAISREPDWRMIADGSQLFAVSGRIWNPTTATQVVPDIRAELKDARGRTVYSWTITRPVATLGPGAAVAFDGAAVDVPPSSTQVSVTFVGKGAGTGAAAVADPTGR